MTPIDATASTQWTPAGIQAITGGRWLSKPTDKGTPLSGLGIDSRTITPGQVFLAVKGEQFDGHDYIASALQAGAVMAIVDQDMPTDAPRGMGVLQVDNTVQALQQLARAHRQTLRQAGCTVIAVVGSNGKTTTRHLIHAVLSSKFKGIQSPKSFNNHLGVPLTLLSAEPGDRFMVAEVGTNHPGEIAELGALLQPDAAVVTCIGREHLEFFGDLAGVAKEEASILRCLPEENRAFIESDAYRWVRDTPDFKHVKEPTIYGRGVNGVMDKYEHHGSYQRFAIGSGVTIDLPLLAPHDVDNALAAVAVGRSMGVQDAEIKAALEAIRPMPGRLEINHFGPVTVIDDTYNSNPDSAEAALSVLAQYPIEQDGRRVVVIADMLELGDAAEPSHRALGKTLADLCREGTVGRVILIGGLMSGQARPIAEARPNDGLEHYPSADITTATRIAQQLRPHDVILFKGSRGMQLERLLPAVRQRFAAPTNDRS